MPSLRGRSPLVQRAILTAISDVRLVDCDYEVHDSTVGSVTMANLCSTTLHADDGATASLKLVLAQRDALDYGQIGACINARIADLDCLSVLGPLALE